jgi:acyl-homoserine-lactone acylase
VLMVIWGKNEKVTFYSVHQFSSATLDEKSPHYADQSLLLAQGKLKPVWFDEDDILIHLEREYVPGEEVK